MNLKNVPEKVKPFVFHGMELEIGEKQAKGDCPFCSKENHFYVEVKTGKWSCKRCEQAGNIYSFLAILHNESLSYTTEADYEELSQDRKLPVYALRDFQLAKSLLTQEWLIPTTNLNGVLNNLYRYTEIDGQMRVLCTPTCKQSLFGLPLRNDKQKRRRLVEGPWDTIAMYDTLKTIRRKGGKNVLCKPNTGPCLFDKIGVVGMPGAGTFQEEWCPVFEGLTLDVVCDSDHPKVDEEGKVRYTTITVDGKKQRVPFIPGWVGQQRTLEILKQSRRQPKEINQIIWGKEGYDPELKDGYDYRDLYIDNGVLKANRILEERLHEVYFKRQELNEEIRVDPIECTSFETLVDAFQECGYFMTDNLKQTLAVCAAVVISTPLPHDQLFLRVIGPPGSAKTTIAEALSSAREYCLPRSIVTGFHSGYTGGEPGRKRKKDASLINDMQNRCVIMKDADTLIQHPRRDQILSEFRDIYDGVSRAQYRNEVKNDYENIRTTFILCGTDELRTMNRTALGERFLDIEIMSRNQDTRQILDRAVNNAYFNIASAFQQPDVDPNTDADVHLSGDRKTKLHGVTYGFLQHLMNTLRSRTVPELSQEAKDQLESIGEFISFMRARIRREKGDLMYRPRAELATRLCSQMVRLAVCLAVVLDKPGVDDDVLSIVQKVARDTSEGFQYEIITALIEERKEAGLSVLQLSRRLSLPETSIRRILHDMQEFKIVERCVRPNNSGQRGRDVHLWRATNHMIDLYDKAFGHVSKTEPSPEESSSKGTLMVSSEGTPKVSSKGTSSMSSKGTSSMSAPKKKPKSRQPKSNH